jgi:hypothetical protein
MDCECVDCKLDTGGLRRARKENESRHLNSSPRYNCITCDSVLLLS